MRILFLTAEPPWPLDQGDKLRNYYLLRFLASKHQVTLATYVSPSENNNWQQEIGCFCNCIHTVSLSHRQKMFNALRLPHLPLTIAARASLKMRKLLKELTQEREFDLVFACQLKMGGFLNCCTAAKKVLELTDVLGIYRSRMGRIVKGLPAKLISLFEERKITYWETKLAKGADLVLLVSPIDAQVLRKRIDNNVKVLPNGVDIEYFKVLPASNKPVLIFYGHLRYPPNADGIVWFARDILPLVREYVPDVELLVVGKEPPQEVKMLARLPGVTLTGYVSDLRPYLSQASVVVVPLRFGAGVRNKILESLACGRAIVSTSLGCEGLAVSPGLHLEVADNPNDFAHRVINLLHDREKRSFLSQNGRMLIEDRYSWNAIGKELNCFLNNIFKDKNFELKLNNVPKRHSFYKGELSLSKTALITGITGQDGAYLAQLLLSKGYRVYGAFRRSSIINLERLDYLGIREQVELIPMDLLDLGNIIRVLEKVRPDEVYNLAAQSFVAVSFEQPVATGQITGLGAANMLEGVRIVNPKIKFYQASSSEMFGKVLEVPQNENTPFYPRSPYAVAKLYAHWMTVNYREAYGIYACSGILFNHESPLRGAEFVTRKITLTAARIKCGQEKELRLGNLDAKRDWGYAPEFVEAMWLMLQKSAPEDFVIATGETHSVQEFVEEAFAFLGLDWREYVVVDPAFYRPADVELLIGDASSARERLEWEPHVTFKELVKVMTAADMKRVDRK